LLNQIARLRSGERVGGCKEGLVEDAGKPAVPAWYWVAVVAALLFELAGCYFYLAEVMMSRAEIMSLPLDQRQMLAARPSWYYAAFGVAVWIGLVGVAGLALRKAWADRMLLASLVAVIVQFSAIFIVPEMRLVTSDALLGPVIIIMCAYAIWQLALLAKRRGWLG
jgi:hypothetical protein